MNPILLSVYGSEFENYEHLRSCMAVAEGIGAELAISPEKPGFNKRLMSQLDSFRGSLVSFHAPFEQIEAASPEGSEENQRYLQSYELSFPIAQAFGARYIVMHTNQCSVSEDSRARLQRQSLETIRKVAARAREEDVTLLVENVGEPLLDSVLFRQSEYIDIFKKNPDLDSLIDIGHAILNRWNMEELISSLAGRIRAYHIHSNDGIDDVHWPISKGILDLPGVAALIARYTPEAYIVLEYAPGAAVGPELYRADIELLKSLLK